jgi:hypothetical protein
MQKVARGCRAEARMAQILDSERQELVVAEEMRGEIGQEHLFC